MLISINKVKKWFDEGNIIVCGKKGKGKDVLFGNVIARIKRPYISNIDYTKDDRYIPLNYVELDCGGNTWRNVLSGKLNYYEFPYGDKVNIYHSDVGNGMPCQYDKELDEEFPSFPMFLALQRHLADSCYHCNAQAYERPWKKIREQAEEVYIRCIGCKVICGIVFAQFVYYNREQSCIDQIPPFPYKEPFFKKKTDKINIDLEKTKYLIQYGEIKKYTYICINKSKHDTRAFRTMFANGDKNGKYNAEYFEENGLFGKGPIKKKKQKKGSDSFEKQNTLPF